MKPGPGNGSPPAIELHTARLLLRAVTPEEAQDLQRGYEVGSISRGDGYPVHRTPGAARRVIEEPDTIVGMFLLIRRDDGKAIGDCSLERQRNSDAVWMSYEVAEPARRQGYAAEAVARLAAWAARQPGVGRVLAEIVEGNLASERTARAAGFRRTAELRGQAWQWQGPSPTAP